MRPFFARQALWAYPMYAGIGGAFGYWLTGVEDRQMRLLSDTRERLLEKRRRRADRDLHEATDSQKHGESIFASPLVVKEIGIDVPGGERKKAV